MKPKTKQKMFNLVSGAEPRCDLRNFLRMWNFGRQEFDGRKRDCEIREMNERKRILTILVGHKLVSRIQRIEFNKTENKLSRKKRNLCITGMWHLIHFFWALCEIARGAQLWTWQFNWTLVLQGKWSAYNPVVAGTVFDRQLWLTRWSIARGVERYVGQQPVSFALRWS